MKQKLVAISIFFVLLAFLIPLSASAMDSLQNKITIAVPAHSYEIIGLNPCEKCFTISFSASATVTAIIASASSPETIVTAFWNYTGTSGSAKISPNCPSVLNLFFINNGEFTVSVEYSYTIHNICIPGFEMVLVLFAIIAGIGIFAYKAKFGIVTDF